MLQETGYKGRRHCSNMECGQSVGLDWSYYDVHVLAVAGDSPLHWLGEV